MDWNEINALITMSASMATAVGVFIAARQLQMAKQQSRSAFEDAIEQQYRQIIISLPVETLLNVKLSDEQLSGAMRYFYAYFDLSNNEIFLHQKNRISSETWQLWLDGIKSNMQRPSFDQAWKTVKNAVGKYEFRELQELEFDGYRLR